MEQDPVQLDFPIVTPLFNELLIAHMEAFPDIYINYHSKEYGL